MQSLLYKKYCEVSSAKNTLAVESRDSSLSYPDLLADINFLADFIEKLSGKNHFVGLNIDASAAYVVALFAVNKIKKAFAPMGSAYPKARIEKVVQKTGMQLIVSTNKQSVVGELLGKKTELTTIETPSGLTFYLYVLNTPAADSIETDDVAYLLSTSGSTGEPKLILGSEKGLMHFVTWQQKTFNIDSTVRGSFLSPVTFDVSLRDILSNNIPRPIKSVKAS